MVIAATSVGQVAKYLAGWAMVEEPIAGDVPADLIAHGVVCSDLLAAHRPDDPGLQIAGLLHDVGLLLRPGDELGHPNHGARWVRGLFGDRVADLVALHVDAQRYLEYSESGYEVSPPPTAAFAEQPVPMAPDETRRFEQHQLFDDVVELRRCDDAAEGTGHRADAADLARMAVRMREAAARAGAGAVAGVDMPRA